MKVVKKSTGSNLRKRAEAILRARPGSMSSTEMLDLQHLMEELEIHQTELEIQNQELIESQLALAQSRDRYANLYDFAPVGYLTLDLKGKILESNLATALMLGVNRSELIGVQIGRFIAPEAADEFYLHRREVFEQESKKVCEIRMHKADGQTLDIQVESIVYKTGDELSQFTTLTDITERKKAEQELRQLNEELEQRVGEQTDEIQLLASAISNLGEGVGISAARGDWEQSRILFVNENLCRFTGYQIEELTGNAFASLCGELTDRAELDRIERELAKGSPCSAELILYRRDGSSYYGELFITPLFNSGGECSHYVSIHRDISEKKLAEEELRRKHELNEGIINTSQHIVLLLDRQGRVEQFNPYFAELSGWHLDEVKGKDWFETFLPARDRQSIRELFEKSCEGATQAAGNVNPILTRDGREREIEWYDVPLTDTDGELIALLCTGQDITERRQTEKTLRSSHAELEAAVNRRTQDLEQAKTHAEEASASKSRFLAAASHDLRQPLQSLGMYLEVLSRKSQFNREQLAIRDNIVNSLNLTQNLLDSLLDISRLQTGDVVPEKKVFPVRDLLQRIVADNKPQAELKGLTLKTRISDCSVYSDPALLERIIENIIVNAIRYTEQGVITVRCNAGKETARISVIDTGIGIAPEEQHRIFEEYYQLSNPMRDREKGLGLGLSIVKHIADLLGHRLDVSSKPGKGSIFTIELPRREAEQESIVQPQAALNNRQNKSREVLLVDDDVAILDSITLLLNVEGYTVQSARNGREALKLIEAGYKPDMMICDYRLPGENGIKMIRRIKDILGKDLPAIIVTGDTQLNKSELAGMGFCEMLHKPVDGNRLLGMLDKIV